MVGGELARAKRVDEHDEEVGADEGKIVVAAVPQHDIGTLLGAREDLAIVNARVDDVSSRDVRLVLLALLDRAIGGVEIGARGEALHPLAREIAVGHRMAQHGRAQAAAAQMLREKAGHLGLAAPRAHGADRDHREVRLQHRGVRTRKQEARAERECARGQVHDRLVRHVAIGEHDLSHLLAARDGLELALLHDGNALRIEGTRELGRVAPSADARNLGRREGDDLDARVVAIEHVEVVEVAPGRAENDEPGFRRAIGGHGSRSLMMGRVVAASLSPRPPPGRMVCQ